MILFDLLQNFFISDERTRKIQIQGLSLDSRTVTPGEVFIALPGSKRHGMTYAAQAVRHGAVAILFEHWDGELPNNTPCIEVADLKSVVGRLAMQFMGKPARGIQVIGVTGTNGKTTCVHFISELIESCGQSAGQIGTLGVSVGREKLSESDRTTPDPVSLAKFFNSIRERSVKVVAMEVSSHALVQARVSGIPFKVGIFTNLSRDHLDYHDTMENYFAAKKLLFVNGLLKAAVINIDDIFGMRLASEVKTEVLITFGRHASATARVMSIEPSLTGTEVVLKYNNQIFNFSIPLLGEFNALNAIAAVLAVHCALGLDLAIVFGHVERLVAAPGRMELFESADLATCVVDYAHTPDALEKALITARLHTYGAVWVVFGCGGDRDIGKRPMMGATASRFADHVILTSDNPRSENPQSIINQIVCGMGRQPIYVNINRAQAIEQAVNRALPDDLILIAGKGHEHTQTIGNEVQFYSDRIEVAKYYDPSALRGSNAS